MDLPGRSEIAPHDKFFIPLHLALSKLLNKWAKVYTHGHDGARPTQFRKFLESDAREKDAVGPRSADAACSNAHIPNTGFNNYVVDKPKVAILSGKRLIGDFLAECVEWPKEEDLTEGMLEERLRIIYTFYRRGRRATAAAAGEVQGGGEDVPQELSGNETPIPTPIDPAMEGGGNSPAPEDGPGEAAPRPAPERPVREEGGEDTAEEKMFKEELAWELEQELFDGDLHGNNEYAWKLPLESLQHKVQRCRACHTEEHVRPHPQSN